MDSIDQQLLKLLSNNGRATASELSRKVNLSVPAVSERLRKLESTGTIDYYGIRINRELLGYKLMAFIFVNIDLEENIDSSRVAIAAYPEVLECHQMAGEYDYLLKVLLEDTKELEYFISKKLKRIKGVQKSNTLIGLSTSKDVLNRMEA